MYVCHTTIFAAAHAAEHPENLQVIDGRRGEVHRCEVRTMAGALLAQGEGATNDEARAAVLVALQGKQGGSP